MTLTNLQYLDDNEVIARYLSNQLSELERKSFEEYFIANPEVLKELNRTAKFKSGLIDLQREGSLDRILQSGSNWTVSRWLAIAASLILVVGMSVLFYEKNPPSPAVLSAKNSRSSVVNEARLNIASSFQLQRTRSSEYDATIEIPAAGKVVALSIKPSQIRAGSSYTVELSKVSATNVQTTVSSIGGVALDDDGFAAITMNPALLVPGVYSLRISAENHAAVSSAESEEFLIELVPSPPAQQLKTSSEKSAQ